MGAASGHQLGCIRQVRGRSAQPSRVFRNWRLIKSLGTEDLTENQGELWNFLLNVEWEFNPTKLWAGDSPVDSNKILRKSCIVPRPLQKPHPKVCAPFSYSMETAKFWASDGAKMVSFVTADKEEFMPVILENCLKAAHGNGLPQTTNNDVLAPGAHLMMGKTPAKTKTVPRNVRQPVVLGLRRAALSRSARPVEPVIDARYDRTGCGAG